MIGEMNDNWLPDKFKASKLVKPLNSSEVIDFKPVKDKSILIRFVKPVNVSGSIESV